MWLYRKRITIDKTKVQGSLINFPVLIYRASDADLASKAQPDGDDIYFTKDDGVTKLDHEIERYVSATGELWAWVKVLSLSSSADTVLWMYYGNPNAGNQQNPTGVWDSNFQFVSHMKDDPDNAHVKDSTINAHNGDKKAANEPAEAAGQIGKAQSSDGTDDYVKVNHRYQITEAITLEVWVKLITQQGGWRGIARKNEASGSWDFGLAKDEAHMIRGWILVGGNSIFAQGPVLSVDTLYYAVMTYDRSYVRLYMDGNEVAATAETGVIDDHDAPFYLHCSSLTLDEYLNALIDEARISNSCRSADWIKTCYNNQKSPTTFLSFGSEQPSYSIPELMLHDLIEDNYAIVDPPKSEVTWLKYPSVFNWDFLLSPKSAGTKTVWVRKSEEPHTPITFLHKRVDMNLIVTIFLRAKSRKEEDVIEARAQKQNMIEEVRNTIIANGPLSSITDFHMVLKHLVNKDDTTQDPPVIAHEIHVKCVYLK